MEYPLKWADGTVQYFGIWLSRNVQELWNTNYGRAVTWLEGKVETWSRLPLSLAGRIAIAKMIILPKFLYLFINLPLTQAFFKTMRSLLVSLVWAGKQASVSWELLTLPLSQGGLGAPDIPLYAYCAQAQFLHYWVHPIPFQPQVVVETDRVAPTPLQAALHQSYKRLEMKLIRWRHYVGAGQA